MNAPDVAQRRLPAMHRECTPMIVRFWRYVNKDGPDGCWIWMASRDSLGYGQINKGRHGEGVIRAHRVAYELLVGPIPEGLELDHLCRVRACLNPTHLEPVTHRENVLRGTSPVARLARQTHCIHGHPLSGANLYLRPDTGARQCKACHHLRRIPGPNPSRSKAACYTVQG